MFAWRYVWWKSWMLFNAVRQKREYLALGGAALLLGLSGGSILALRLGEALAEVYLEEPEQLERILSLFAFSIYLALFFMALANVVTRFFGTGRLDERENLMGPLSPSALFAAEVFDALRLPAVFVSALALIPASVACFEAELSLWLVPWLWVNALLLYAQPTLIVLSLSIAIVRLLPRALIGKRVLLFAFMFCAAVVGLAGLDTLRLLFSDGPGGWYHLLPSYPVALIFPSVQSSDWTLLFKGFAINVSVAVALYALANYLYRVFFLEALEHFHVGVSVDEVGTQEATLLFRMIRRVFGGAIAALVVKDLRSFRRETSQRIAFTLIGALMSALVVADLLSGFGVSIMFLPIFGAYAMFLVCCQGLSTFSAEGGHLENLARLPLKASQLLTAKIVAHVLLYSAVAALAAGLLAVAPSMMPWYMQMPLVLAMAVLGSPFVVALAVVTVSLGAIFPKPGEGGAQKEISIFAMGLFLQLMTLMFISVVASVFALALGSQFAFLFPLVVVLWAVVLYVLWRLARQAVIGLMGL